MNFRSSDLFELIQFKSIRKFIKDTVCLGPNLDYGSDFIKTKGYQWSNLGHRSRHGWLTAAPAGDGGGAMHRAAAPRPLLWRGSPGAMTSLYRWGLALCGWRGLANSPKGLLGGGGDRSSACDGVPFFLKLNDGESILRWSSGSSKTTSSFPLVYASSS
jgi:hypothetical protein